MIQLADLPTRRNEAWKYSDLRAAMEGAERLLAPLEAIGGRGPIASLAHGLATSETKRTFTVGDDGDVWTSRTGAHEGSVTRIVAPVGSSGLVFEHLDAWVDQNTEGGPKLSAALADIVVEDHATLTRVLVQTSSDQYRSADIVQLSETNVSVGEGATFQQFILGDGGNLARVETHVSVEGRGATVELNGVYLAGHNRHAPAGRGRHVDLTSSITHHAPGAETRQLIKGVAAKGGRGVFQGKIVVERAAQQTDARQYHHGMLLEAGAEIFAKPELLIHADDVQCAHGNTAGGLDEAAKFYLRSRGVPEKQARAMLIEAFLVGAIPEGLPEAIDAELRERIGKWLEAHA